MSKIKVMHVLNTGGFLGVKKVAIKIIKGTPQSADCTYVSPDGNNIGVRHHENLQNFRMKLIR